MQILPIGGLCASNTAGDHLRTYGLGSCVAVVFVCPASTTAAMAHVVLPSAKFNPGAGHGLPGYYADQAIPNLLQALADKGCKPGRHGIMVKMAGGANLIDTNHFFQIGQRNIFVIKEMLNRHGLVSFSEDLGGEQISRTVEVAVASGRVTVTRSTGGGTRCMQL